MEGLTIFSSEEFGDIRTIENNGEIWFIGADICNCLNLPNHSKALSRIDEDDKCNLKLHLPGRDPICGTIDITIGMNWRLNNNG